MERLKKLGRSGGRALGRLWSTEGKGLESQHRPLFQSAAVLFRSRLLEEEFLVGVCANGRDNIRRWRHYLGGQTMLGSQVFIFGFVIKIFF